MHISWRQLHENFPCSFYYICVAYRIVQMRPTLVFNNRDQLDATPCFDYVHRIFHAKEGEFSIPLLTL